MTDNYRSFLLDMAATDGSLARVVDELHAETERRIQSAFAAGLCVGALIVGIMGAGAVLLSSGALS